MSKAQEAAELYEKLRSVRAVARELGISRSAAHDRLRTASKRGLLIGTPPALPGFEIAKISERANSAGEITGRTISQKLAPCKKFEISPEMYLKGVTALVDADGRIIKQYLLTRKDENKSLEVLAEFAEGLRATLPRESCVKAPKVAQSGLLTQYTITDLHFGMLAWGEETRAGDYDLEIAESQLVRWFEQAIELAPASEVGLFAQLGDFLHYDSLKAITPEHGNLLDADSRFQKVVRVAARVTRQIVAKLLAKHNLVHLKWCSANHDPASSAIFRELLHTLYEREPRVSVDISPSEYYCYEWGQTALFYHHGHRKKPTEVDRVFAALFSELFGRTKFRYAHCGHKHEDRVVETPLMRVEQHRTLAPPDAYAASGGWISGRSASSITYCQKFGEVMRNTISVEALR